MRIQKYILMAVFGAFLAVACSKDDEGIGIQTKPDYEGKINDNGIPTYSDYYISIAGWDNRSNWNLANVHDPSIAYFDGYYYMFGTSASYGNEHEKANIGRQYQGKRSKDLVNWTHIYGPMNTAPAWVKDSLNNIRSRMNLAPIENPSYGYWAPVIRTVGNKVRMYYSVVINDNIDGKNSWGERAFIGMCESTDPSDPDSWVDHGYVVCSSTDKAYDRFREGTNANGISSYGNAYFYFNAIDPTYIVTGDDRHWLIYGSWHSGFALLELNPTTGKPLNAYDASGNYVGLGEPWGNNPNYGTRIAARRNNYRWQGSEAPEVIYKDGYYYLFMAYDGLDIPYNTRVVRATSIEGPYYDIEGTNNTLNGGDSYPIVTHPYKFENGYGWVGISHCCIFQQEGTGDWFYCSQARLPRGVEGNESSNAIMMGHVRRIVWCPSSPEDLDDLWPLALPERYAGLTKKAVAAGEIPGTYEVINLEYVQGKMDESSKVVISTDGNIYPFGSDEAIGTWSFDEAKQYTTITIGNVSTICVMAHEADWERVETVTGDNGIEEQVQARKETVVFAGTRKNLKATLWGKKII